MNTQNTMTANDLQVEYRKNPIGVDVSPLRFSWIPTVPSEFNRNRFQTAYEIEVSTNPDFTADVITTGKVVSSRVNAVVIDNLQVKNHKTYYWRVRLTDECDVTGPWSMIGQWTSGFVTGTMNGEWIGYDAFEPLKRFEEGRTYRPATYLRGSAEVAEMPLKALYYGTALGVMNLYCNGSRLGNEYFLPGWSDYRKRIYTVCYDISHLLKTGKNVFGAILGDGWFRGCISNIGQNFYGKETRFRGEIVLIFADGHEEHILTSEEWKAAAGAIVASDMQDGEEYDARQELGEWTSPDFDDSNWLPVAVGAELNPVMRTYPGAPVRRTGDEFTAVRVAEPVRGRYVFDFGQNFAGFVRLCGKFRKGQVITLKFGEMLNSDGTVYRENLRSAVATDRYTAKGGDVEIWEPTFTFHGFRYVELTGIDAMPDASLLTGIALSSDLPRTGKLVTSNDLINQIYSNTWWGQRSNYFEIPTDCPQRDERLGWTGDTQIFVRTGSYNQKTATLFDKYTEGMVDAMSEKGQFPNMAPTPYENWFSPGWGDCGLIVPWTMYEFYDDPEFLERNYEAMKKQIAYYESTATDYIGVDEGFGDWLAIGSETPKDLITTAYFAHSTRILAESAAVLGKMADAAYYSKLVEKIKAAFQRKYVSSDGKIGSDSQTGYLLAICFQLLTPEQQKLAGKHLRQAIAAKDYHLSTGFLGINVLLPALSAIGASDLAYRLLQNRTFPSWGYSIDQGATTIWERWNSYTLENGFGPVEMNSFNHYAYGACVEWMYSSMLGIKPTMPGFRKICIAPEFGDGVDEVCGSYISIQGKIEVSWKRVGKTFEVMITIPVNTTAEIILPGIHETVGSGTYQYHCNGN